MKLESKEDAINFLKLAENRDILTSEYAYGGSPQIPSPQTSIEDPKIVKEMIVKNVKGWLYRWPEDDEKMLRGLAEDGTRHKSEDLEAELELLADKEKD